MTLKRDLYNQCQNALNERLQTIQLAISDIQNALLSETKSSAGDKHETGRAMLQLEREKAGYQLAEIYELKALLQKINPESTTQNAALGSIVYTTTANYFIALSLGELRVKSVPYYAISLATPIAQLLLSKRAGDTVHFRDRAIEIVKIT
jgi:NADPH-dependent curcumin reductase CurA